MRRNRLSASTLQEMTKYRPRSRSPQYRRWRTLHAKHIAAYRSGDLYQACVLADAKYDLYLKACAWRVAMILGAP
jgi:hypothetical protein